MIHSERGTSCCVGTIHWISMWRLWCIYPFSTSTWLTWMIIVVRLYVW